MEIRASMCVSDDDFVAMKSGYVEQAAPHLLPQLERKRPETREGRLNSYIRVRIATEQVDQLSRARSRFWITSGTFLSTSV